MHVAVYLPSMTLIESIIRAVQNLPLRKQVEVARYVNRLNPKEHEEHAAVLQRTHGALDVADGNAFEQAMNDARRLG